MLGFIEHGTGHIETWKNGSSNDTAGANKNKG
jgi:hypothetical protein